MKILDKRNWKWYKKRNYKHWYCVFTKYGYTTRLIKIKGGDE